MTKNNLSQKNQKKLYVLMFVLIAVLIGAVAVSLVFSYRASKSKSSAPTTQSIVKEKSEKESNKEEEKIDTIDTSDWLTYENKEYGYSVKYPRDWEMKEESQERTTFKKIFKEFSPQILVDGEIIIEVFSNKNKLPIRDWIRQNEAVDENTIKSLKEVELGGQKGLERIINLELDGSEYKDIFISIDNLVYDIQPNTSARFPNEQLEQENNYLIRQSNKIIAEILKTIQFKTK